MKEEILNIASDLREGFITTNEAVGLLKNLFDSGGSNGGSICDECTAYPFDERGETPLCGTCVDNPKNK